MMCGLWFQNEDEVGLREYIGLVRFRDGLWKYSTHKGKIKMEKPVLDRKYRITATSTEHGGSHTEYDSVLFLAKDKLLLPLLHDYLALCMHEGVDERQIQGVELLIERVKWWQEHNPTKTPDVDTGPSGIHITLPNVFPEEKGDEDRGTEIKT